MTLRSLLPLSWLFVSGQAYSQLPPIITAWTQNTTETGFAGALTNIQEVNYSDTYVYIKTEDIPSWIPILYDWPNNPWFAVPMNYQFRFRRIPMPNKGPETKTGYGHIGLWKNGCSIYNPKDAKSYNDDLVWFQNAWYWEHLLGETFDDCLGHPNGSGEYHTHVSPECLYDMEDSTHVSPLIGFAFDHYPIYGGYGHADPLDTTSAIVRMKSSYRLRNITDRTTLPDGTLLTPDLYGPTLDSVPLGGYMEDFEFIEGLGDLDQHNGRFCKTTDYPDGIYAYFTTIDWVDDIFGYQINPVFPYVLGTTYYGEVYPADGNTGPGSGFVVIDEPVTLYQLTTSNLQPEDQPLDVRIYPNPASGRFNLQIDGAGPGEKFIVSITDINGSFIRQLQITPERLNTYNVDDLANGLYAIRIATSTQVQSYRLVIAR